jgi:integrase
MRDWHRRDLRSAVVRVAALLGEPPEAAVLDVPVISAKLARLDRVTACMSAKTLQNVRAGFLGAVKAAGLMPRRRLARALTTDWIKLLDGQSTRTRLGLARLARFASARRITPRQVDDAVVADMMREVRNCSLHRHPNRLHRTTAQVWNEMTRRWACQLKMLSVPSFAKPSKRIAWSALGNEFRQEIDNYLRWCGGEDVFAADARAQPMAPRTVELCRNQLRAAVTALVESGVDVGQLTSLAELVSPRNFKAILTHRYEGKNGLANTFNIYPARALIRIAREWVKLGATELAEFNRLAGRLPNLTTGLTAKNRAALRQFDDGAKLRQLYALPDQLWVEVKRDRRCNHYTLATAQAALAIGLLSYAPIRLQNLATLRFGVHLFVRQGPSAISTLEIPAHEVKNGRELAFDLPPQLAKMLLEYLDSIAPRIIRRRPERLFVNIDGRAKHPQSVALLIRKTLRKRIGIELTPHQFRHLSARIVLEAEPGAYETVKQLLGHNSLNTTTTAYTGIDSARAARHHHRIIEDMLASAPLSFGRRGQPRIGRSA